MRVDLRLFAAGALAVAVTVLASCGQGSERDPEGQTLARQYACLSCHGQNGEGGTGPAWKGLYGSTVTLQDGSTAVVDDEYLRTSVLNPSAQIPEGVTVPMPVNPNVTAEDLEKIIEYIKSLADA